MQRDNISRQLLQMDGTYFRAIPRDIVRIIASMLTYTTSIEIKCVSSNRLCGANDYAKFLAIDHKYRRYIMYGRKCRDAKIISEQHCLYTRAVFDKEFYTISADGKNVQRFDINSLIEYPESTTDGIKTGIYDLIIVRYMHDGTVKKTKPIEIMYTCGIDGDEEDSEYDFNCHFHTHIRYRIGHEKPPMSVKINKPRWGKAWIVDHIHHALYIQTEGHSRRALVVHNMLTGERVFQSYGETATMIAKLQNYWVTLNDKGAIAAVYSDDSCTQHLSTISCAKKGYTNHCNIKLAVGTDPNTFVVVQDIHVRGGWFRQERHEKWVSTYYVYEHIVFR